MDSSAPHDHPSTTAATDPSSEAILASAPSISPETSGRRQVEQLAQQYQTLETLFALTVSALILMGLGLNLFLFKQSRLARSQVLQQGPIVNRAVTEFHKNREPVVRALISGLEKFSQEDQQFQPIMERYRPYLGQYFMGPRSEADPAVPVAPPKTNQ